MKVASRRHRATGDAETAPVIVATYPEECLLARFRVDGQSDPVRHAAALLRGAAVEISWIQVDCSHSLICWRADWAA